jgi:phage terminase large subunit-like protein
VRSSLAEKAKAKLRSIQADEQSSRCTEIPGLVEWVAIKWPEFERFDYFAPYAEGLETAIGGNLRLAFAAPPQHGKTEFTLRAFLWWATFYPGKRNAYVTYNQDRAHWVAKEFRRIAEHAGFHVTGTLTELVINGSTRVLFTSINGKITGYTIDGVCVIDDPIRDHKQARSPTVRNDTVSWWRQGARTRRHPGTSYVVMATRWHVDDLTGYLTKHEGWRYINLTAIATANDNDDLDAEGRLKSDPLHRFPGESLTKFKPPEFFAAERKDRFVWLAMYQGEPPSSSGRVFAEPGTTDEAGEPRGAAFYSELPKDGYRVAFGLDLACTAKTSADWSVSVECWAVGKRLYVVDVQRKQVEATEFALVLKEQRSRRPDAPMRWYAAGPEKMAAQFLARAGIKIKVFTAVAEKKVRAMGASAAWNRGDILIPDPQAEIRIPGTERYVRGEWLPPFLDVVTNFTGDPGGRDDDVDALAAGFDQLMKKNPMLEALERVSGHGST